MLFFVRLVSVVNIAEHGTSCFPVLFVVDFRNMVTPMAYGLSKLACWDRLLNFNS